MAATAAYMGTWAVLLFAVDFAALGRAEDVKYHRRWTFGFPFWVPTVLFNSLIGMFLAFSVPGTELSEAGIAGGLIKMMGLLGLLLVFVSQTRVNTANYYVSVSNLEITGRRALRLRWPTWAWAIVCAAVIYLLVLLPVVQYMLVTLAWLGVIVLAWIGIALAHAWHSDRSGDVAVQAFPRSFDLPGVISWTISTALGLGILQMKGTWISGYGPFVTLIVAALSYYTLVKIGRRPQPAPADT